METLVALIVGILIFALISGIVIFIVGKLNLGLKVDSFVSAMIAGLFIGIVAGLVDMFVPGTTGIIGAVIDLVIAAAVIYLAGMVLKGLVVDGFVGALVAALAIAVIGWLLAMVLGGMAAA